jgi:hypothetical protein
VRWFVEQLVERHAAAEGHVERLPGHVGCVDRKEVRIHDVRHAGEVTGLLAVTEGGVLQVRILSWPEHVEVPQRDGYAQ